MRAAVKVGLLDIHLNAIARMDSVSDDAEIVWAGVLEVGGNGEVGSSLVIGLYRVR